MTRAAARRTGERLNGPGVEGAVKLGLEKQDGAAQSEDQQGPACEDADHEMEAERERAYPHGGETLPRRGLDAPGVRGYLNGCLSGRDSGRG
jgi:hypothetical protein